jgi:hypothetical protein
MDARTGDAARDAALLAELARLAAPQAPILLHDTTTPPLAATTPAATTAGLQPAPRPAVNQTPSKALQKHHNPLTLWVRAD